MIENFNIKTTFIYPPYNQMIFEEYFYNYYVSNNIKTDREYLPIIWTNYYLSKNYGQSSMEDLQTFLYSLDKSKKYFTIVQWDDGILNDINHLDILVFGQGGGGKASDAPNFIGNIGNVEIPLNNLPSDNINKNRERDILCSFMGVIEGRHPIREKMKNILSNFEDIKIYNSVEYNKFKNLMETSIFSLCPRGYGATSFRINESLMYGTIPIYIYDKPWIPWKNEIDFNTYGILISENEIDKIPTIIKSKTNEDIENYRRTGQLVYDDYYSYKGCSDKIIEYLKK